MEISDLFRGTSLLLVLLNPFLLLVYLIDVVQKVEARRFRSILIKATLLSMAVFLVFAWAGEAIFSDWIQAEFASFQIFGGIIFLLIGLQFVFYGPRTLNMLRGEGQNLVSSIAVPVFIGPGTLSACVVIGKRYDLTTAASCVALACALSAGVMVGLKYLHDYVRPRHEPLVERYIEVTGRLFALVVGTIAVDMVMRGVHTWAEKF